MMIQSNSLTASNFFFPNQSNFYRGKVRDVYSIGSDILVMIACDRISAFDHVLPRSIPYKGQVLNEIASFFLDKTNDIVPNWKISTPDPHVTIGRRCEPIPIEFVLRKYLTGHAWRTYREGGRMLCGNILPEGLKENDPLPKCIITPSTKAHSGHDIDTSYTEILESGLIPKVRLDALYETSFALFERGTQISHNKGLVLVDTKYEFGLKGDGFVLIDEIHTPDSSRFFYLDTYDALQQKGLSQRQLSKEFVREWLIKNGFQGKKGEVIPPMTDDFVGNISERYEELYLAITGSPMKRRSYENIFEQVQNNINNELTKYFDEQ